MGEYHDLYLVSDVLLLTDVFENFRKTCMQYYKLDPCHYFTSPGLSSQALHGLAPKCELINVHELIKTSTNNYVTLLPLENGINLNTKG